MPYPVSDPRSFGSVAKIPLRSLPRSALLQLCDAASRTPDRQHRRLCDAVGLDPEAFGAVPFASIREIGEQVFQTKAASGTVSTAGVHHRLTPLEELGLIRVKRERRGTALAGVVYVSRDALEDARPGRRAPGRDPWSAWREDGVDPQLDLAADEAADRAVDVDEQIRGEAGETRGDQPVIDHGLITDPYSDLRREEDRGAGEPAPGQIRWTRITPETAGPPPDETDPLGRLLALCERHMAEDSWTLRSGIARRWLGALVRAHGAEAIVEALDSRPPDAEPLRHPLAWLGTVLSPEQRGDSRYHGQIVAVTTGDAVEAGAAAGVPAGGARVRRERRASRSAATSPRRAWARVGAHAPVEAEPAGPVEAAAPVADPAAAAAWAGRAKPARIGGQAVERLVAVALVAGVVEVTTGDAFADEWLAAEAAGELAAIGARVAGAAPVPRPAAPPPWDAAPPVPRPPPGPPRDGAASRMAALAAAAGVREAA